MTISVHEALGVLYLSGELDMGTAEAFRASVGPALDGRGELVLDLAELSFIDSMGVRTLAVLSHTVGGGLVLRYPQEAVWRVLELLQFDEMPSVRILQD